MQAIIFKLKYCSKNKKTLLRQGGIEPPSIAWKATMLTITPLTLCLQRDKKRGRRRVAQPSVHGGEGFAQKMRLN